MIGVVVTSGVALIVLFWWVIFRLCRSKAERDQDRKMREWLKRQEYRR
jgi:hypothetical protein